MKQLEKTGESELSRVLDIENLEPGKAYNLTLDIASEECQALAKRFNLPELGDMQVSLTIQREVEEARLHVSGHLSAHLHQTCVVTMENFEKDLKTDFTFEAAAETLIDPALDHEAPEAIVAGKIDLGEVVSQIMALEVDPYPRSPEAKFFPEVKGVTVNEPEIKTQRPFENLSDLLKSDQE